MSAFKGSHKIRITWYPVAEGDEAGKQDTIDPGQLIGLSVPPWQSSFSVKDIVSAILHSGDGSGGVLFTQEVPRATTYALGRQVTPENLAELVEPESRALAHEYLERGTILVVPHWEGGLSLLSWPASDDVRVVTVENDHIADIHPARALALRA